MPLPENMSKSLVAALSADGLLKEDLAQDVASHLESGKPVNWNLLMSKELRSEKEDGDED